MTETLEIAGALEATDEMLMKEISRRRQGALVELYGRHGQRLRTTVESVLREGADADDILQEIFRQANFLQVSRQHPSTHQFRHWERSIFLNI